MKNTILRNIILTVAVSSVIAVPTFAENINMPIVQDIKIVPINYVFKHWAEIYLDKLSVNYNVEELFKDKDLNDYITVEDFKKVVEHTVEKDYVNVPDEVTREAVVYELTKIWAEKAGKDLDNIPIIKMLIYSDTSDIDIKYVNGAYVAYMFDIAKGKGEGIFDPKTNVTYGELAVLINNTINAIEKETTTQPIAKGKYETRAEYEIKDDKVIFDFELMSHYTEPQVLMTGSGQQFELTITNESGEEIYRFSDGKVFTMALLYKTLNPGESLKWQDTWNMTNKDGDKLTSGKYKAEIKILVSTEEEKIDDAQLINVIEFSLNTDYELNKEGVIKSEIAKEVIEKIAKNLMIAIKNKDAESLAEYVHPVKGIRFTPYTTVSLEKDLNITKDHMIGFFEDKNLYTWGNYDGSGEEIKLTPSEYYEKFIYSQDFINAPEIGYNDVLTFGNMIENQFDVYENAIVVEYYIPEINPEYGGLDWQSLRLAFEEYDGVWKLVGIIHNQWTI